MSVINHDAWGFDCNGSPAHIYYAAPVLPGCSEWTGTGNAVYLKPRWRCFVETTVFGDYRFKITANTIEDVIEDIADITPAGWAQTFGGALEPDEYPTEADLVSTFTAQQYLPYFSGRLSVYETTGSTSGCVLYGVECSTDYEGAYDGENVEVTDYADGTFYAEDTAAGSWIITMLLCHGYNKMNYCSTWRISAAVGPDR